MKTLKQKENDESKPGLNHPPGSESSFETARGSQSIDSEQSGSGEPTDNEVSLASLAGKATGPRTQAGKGRSKQNSLKHGIFSKVALLKSESRTALDSLLSGIWENLQPQGKLEEVLVEKLATLLWRQRRQVIAETAEIQKRTEFIEWDEEQRQEDEAARIFDLELDSKDGLMRKITNPKVLQRCLDLFGDLKREVEERGFLPKLDRAFLAKIYGHPGKSHCNRALVVSYALWTHVASLTDEERHREEFPSPEECVKNFLKNLREEIERLDQYKRACASIELVRLKIESLRRNVPDADQLSHLVRYEVHLDRAFDRALSQLERLQRMRAGQPVLPELKVRVSG